MTILSSDSISRCRDTLWPAMVLAASFVATEVVSFIEWVALP